MTFLTKKYMVTFLGFYPAAIFVQLERLFAPPPQQMNPCIKDQTKNGDSCKEHPTIYVCMGHWHNS